MNSSVLEKIREELTLFSRCFSESFAIIFPATAQLCQLELSQISGDLLEKIEVAPDEIATIDGWNYRKISRYYDSELWITISIEQGRVPPVEPIQFLSNMVERVILSEMEHCPVARTKHLCHCPTFGSVTKSAINVLSREITSESIAYISLQKGEVDGIWFSEHFEDTLRPHLSTERCKELYQEMTTAPNQSIAEMQFQISVPESMLKILCFPLVHDETVVGLIGVLVENDPQSPENRNSIELILVLLSDFYLLIHEGETELWVAQAVEKLKWNRIEQDTALGMGNWELDRIPNTISFDSDAKEILNIETLPAKMRMDQLQIEQGDIATMMTNIVEKFEQNSAHSDWYDEIYELTVGDAPLFLQTRSTCYRDASGTPFKFVGRLNDVTEIYQQTIDYKAKTILLQEIVDTIPVSVYWKDRQGIIQGCNQMVATEMGCTSSQEVVGKTIYDFYPTHIANTYWADDCAVMDSGKSYRNAIVGNEESRSWYYASKSPMIDSQGTIIGMIGSHYDISDLKRANENFRNSETRFSTIFNMAPIGLALISYDGTVVDCNNALATILKRDKKKILNASLLSISAPESFDLLAELINRITLYFDRTFHQPVFITDGNGAQIVVDLNLRNVGYLAGTGEVFAITVEDITEQRKLNEEIQNQEIELRHMIDFTYDGELWLNPDRSIRIMSQSVERITGYRRDEIMADPSLLISMITNGSRQLQIDTLENLFTLRPSEPVVVQLHLRNAEGKTSWLEQLGQPVFDENGMFLGVRLSIRDITEQKKLTEKVEESHRQFTLFSSSVDEVFALVNLTTNAVRLVQKSPFEQMFALPFAIVNYGSEFLTSILPQEASSGLKHLIEDFRCNKLNAVNFVQQIRDGLGDERYIEIHIRSAMTKGLVVEEITILAKDVTLDVQLKKQERVRQEQLRHADKMISLGILSAGVAHEINNPNNLIGLNAEFLLQMWEDITPVLEEYSHSHANFTMNRLPYDLVSAELPRLLKGIQLGSNRIKKIVEGMKNYSRNETLLMTEVIDLNEIIHDGLLIVGHSISKMTHNLQVILADNLPMIRGNCQQVEQVFINLITNASQALTDPSQEIHISTGVAGEWVYMSVDDSGCGMSKETVEKISIPFFTTRRDTGGTGLGMSVTHEIIQSHGAQMDIQSKLGHGTTITILFPQFKGADSHE